MTELDQVWSRLLEETATNAHINGRGHIAEYLKLKATNDAIRAAGIGWLFDTLIEIAGGEQGRHRNLTIERAEPHRFDCGNSTMVGSLLSIREGVRCLTTEAGWARVPSDGVMQKGALAYGRVNHFGIPKAGVEIRLVLSDPMPEWRSENGDVVDSSFLRQHVDLLLGV
jgi:hypothetical protein